LIRKYNIPPHLAAAAIVFAVTSLLINTSALSAHQTSRFAAIESIVQHGTAEISQSTFSGTEDRVQYKGRYYSSKPLGLILAGVIVYAPLYLSGISLAGQPGLVIYLLTLFTSGLLHALLAAFLCRALQERGMNERGSLLWSLIICLGTLPGAYSTTFNSHSSSTTLIFISALLALEIRDKSDISKPAIAGCITGISTAFDVPAGFFLCIFSPALIFMKTGRSRALAAFCSGLAFTVLLHGAANFLAYGTPLLVRMAGSFTFEGSYWKSGVLSISDSTPETGIEKLWNFLLGIRGYVWHIPVAALGIRYSIRILAGIRHNRKFLFEEAILASGMFFFLLLFYSFGTPPNVHGGSCTGPRWFLPTVPLLSMIAVLKSVETRTGRILKYCAVLISIIITIIAARNPWGPAFSRLPILDNLTEMTAQYAPSSLDLLIPLERNFIGRHAVSTAKLAEVLESAGRDDLAEIEANRAVRMNPYTSRARLVLVRIYAARGEMKKAQTEVRIIRSYAPDSREMREAEKYLGSLHPD